MTATIVDLAAFRTAKCPPCGHDYLNREIGQLSALIEHRESEAARLRKAASDLAEQGKPCPALEREAACLEDTLPGLRFRRAFKRLVGPQVGGRD